MADRDQCVRKYDDDLATAEKEFEIAYKENECPEINIRRYECLSCLGRGGWGVVYIATTRDNRSVAIKSLEKAKINSVSGVGKIIREKQTQFAMENQFVTKLLGKYKDAKYLYLIFEYAIYSDLRNFMKANGEDFLEESICKKIMVQVAMGIEYVHACKVMIRDLKPDNILLYDGGRVKVADFGLACALKGRPHKIWGSPGYLAPEMLIGQPYEEEVDWWSFAIILYKIVAGIDEHPYTKNGNPGDLDYQKITNYPHTYGAKWSSLSPEVNDLVKAFLKIDASQRPGCKKSPAGLYWREQAWFKDVDWYNVIRGNEQFPIDEDIVDQYNFFEACQSYPFVDYGPDGDDPEYKDF